MNAILRMTEKTMTNLYIWWLSQHHCERIGDGVMLIVAGAPEYLYDEFRSRWGRPGRGRLWVAEQFGVTDIEWDEVKATPLNLDACGGIVIAESELELCRKCPGVVTDLALNLIPSLLKDPLEEDGKS
jgi:hypothetical protein